MTFRPERPPINGSTRVPLYQWNLLERQKPGIPLIKGIATAVTLHEIGALENKKWFVALNWETTHGRTQSPIKAQ